MLCMFKIYYLKNLEKKEDSGREERGSQSAFRIVTTNHIDFIISQEK